MASDSNGDLFFGVTTEGVEKSFVQWRNGYSTYDARDSSAKEGNCWVRL